MPTTSSQLTQAIYDLIYDSLTMAPPGATPATSASTSLMSLAIPGYPLDAADFANPWGPMNPNGDPATAESFAWLVDAVPEASASYTPNGQSVDAIYGQVVYANTASMTPPPPAVSPTPTAAPTSRPSAPGGATSPRRGPEREPGPIVRPVGADLVAARRAVLRTLPAKKQRAFELLYNEGTVPLPHGAAVRTFVESPTFRRYVDRREARDAAVTRYMARYLQTDLTNPTEKARWSAAAPALEAQVGAAERALHGAQAGEVEEALALTSSPDGQNNSVAAIFASARLNYEMSRLGSAMGPGMSWHMAVAQPSNWWSPSANFCDVDLRTERTLRVNDASRFRALGGPAAVTGGMWQRGATRRSLSIDTVSIRVRFKYARVSVRRPWLDASLFSLGGWSMAGRPRHQLSTGTLAANPGIFPLLPTSIIVARDLQISASWSHEDATFLRASLADGERFAFGPFALAGRFRRPHAPAPTAASATFDGTNITAPGLQIIRWVSTLIPACPPLDG